MAMMKAMAAMEAMAAIAETKVTDGKCSDGSNILQKLKSWWLLQQFLQLQQPWQLQKRQKWLQWQWLQQLLKIQQ
jgi:hypothetical protein